MRAEGVKALLVYPRFTASSFWSFKETCESVGARYPAPPLGLITVAALLPESWEPKLIDCNTSDLDDDDIASADIVFTGGMLPQQADALRIIERCQRLGKPVVAGGPDATSSPHIYKNADFRVLGEAETVIEALVEAFESGKTSGTFEAEKFTADVARSPTPRFDLLKFSDYLHIGVQYSRGCPFNCEFCDIIELYGRVPRTKTTRQMLVELDKLLALGYRGHVDFVDDNLIGNKKALKKFLPELIEWQQRNGYPFEFSTEASINLADDDELLALLRAANFFVVFVGIESPDPETLVSAQKKQNTRRSLADSVHKIYSAGIFVHAGFILGFDTDKEAAADMMIDCIEDTAIPVCMVGLLYALPNTQLTRRLQREGRLHPGHDDAGEGEYGDQCTAGLNFDTARPRSAILADYAMVLEKVFEPDAFFGRVRRVGRMLGTAERLPAGSGGKPGTIFGGVSLVDWRRFFRLAFDMTIRNPRLAWKFWSNLADCLVRNPQALKAEAMLMSLYLHLGPFSKEVLAKVRAEMRSPTKSTGKFADAR